MDLSDTLLHHFSELEDPRLSNHNFRHELSDILIIAILATICGADNWVEVARFGKAKEDWLRTFLKLPHGIPSHDTFGRLFSLLCPEKFHTCFLTWVQSLTVDLKKEIIALDGKTVRGSGNKRKEQSAIHLVSAWASDQRLLLAQAKTTDKSNEITAIPHVLKMIDIEESIVTIDALGCQKAIAKQIVNQGADYVLSLKKNHPTLFKSVETVFEKGKACQFKKMLHRRKVEKVHDHGRIETRRYTLMSARDGNLEFSSRFPHLKGIGKVEVTRTTHHEVTYSTRYFVTSLSYEAIDDFMRSVRKHWQIEVDLHWSLDVSFREDLCQVRKGHAPENLALLRRIALNLLKQEKSHKNGITCRRKTAGWDHRYLLKVLQVSHALKG